jgi:hypothetical protein
VIHFDEAGNAIGSTPLIKDTSWWGNYFRALRLSEELTEEERFDLEAVFSDVYAHPEDLPSSVEVFRRIFGCNSNLEARE